MPNRWFSQSLTIVLLIVLGVVLLAPILSVVWGGFQEDGEYTTYWFGEIFDEISAAVGDRYESLKLAVLPASWNSIEGEPLDGPLPSDVRMEYLQEAFGGAGGNLYGNGLINSVVLAGLVTTLCLLISLPLAMLAENFAFRGKRIWLALIQVPLILPPFVGAIGMKKLLSRNGGVNSILSYFGFIDPSSPIDWMSQPFWACVALEALYLYPITFLNVQAALANIDPALDEAARNLGAGPWRRFWPQDFPSAESNCSVRWDTLVLPLVPVTASSFSRRDGSPASAAASPARARRPSSTRNTPARAAAGPAPSAKWWKRSSSDTNNTGAPAAMACARKA